MLPLVPKNPEHNNRSNHTVGNSGGSPSPNYKTIHHCHLAEELWTEKNHMRQEHDNMK